MDAIAILIEDLEACFISCAYVTVGTVFVAKRRMCYFSRCT